MTTVDQLEGGNTNKQITSALQNKDKWRINQEEYRELNS